DLKIRAHRIWRMGTLDRMLVQKTNRRFYEFQVRVEQKRKTYWTWLSQLDRRRRGGGLPQRRYDLRAVRQAALAQDLNHGHTAAASGTSRHRRMTGRKDRQPGRWLRPRRASRACRTTSSPW